MTPTQSRLIAWFRMHAAAQAAAGDRGRAIRVIHAALDLARRQANPESEEARELFDVLMEAGGLLLHGGKAREAATCLSEALELEEAPEVNPTHAEIAEIRQRLGSAHDFLGDEEAAATEYEASLELLGEMDPPPLESVAHLANNLGMIRRNQGRFEEAALLYRRAQEIFEEMGEDYSTDLATICNNQGSLFWAWEQPELARDFHLTALKLRRDHLPENHPDIGQSACNLAAVYHDLGDYEKAARNYERALVILRKSLAEDPDTYEIVASNFADLLDDSGQNSKANRIRQQTARRVDKARKKQEAQDQA